MNNSNFKIIADGKHNAYVIENNDLGIVFKHNGSYFFDVKTDEHLSWLEVLNNKDQADQIIKDIAHHYHKIDNSFSIIVPFDVRYGIDKILKEANV